MLLPVYSEQNRKKLCQKLRYHFAFRGGDGFDRNIVPVLHFWGVLKQKSKRGLPLLLFSIANFKNMCYTNK